MSSRKRGFSIIGEINIWPGNGNGNGNEMAGNWQYDLRSRAEFEWAIVKQFFNHLLYMIIFQRLNIVLILRFRRLKFLHQPIGFLLLLILLLWWRRRRRRKRYYRFHLRRPHSMMIIIITGANAMISRRKCAASCGGGSSSSSSRRNARGRFNSPLLLEQSMRRMFFRDRLFCQLKWSQITFVQFSG